MIPGNQIASLASAGSFLAKHSVIYGQVNLFRGGTSIGDGSAGIDVQDWRCRLAGGNSIVVEPLTIGATVTLPMPGVTAASAAFDRNMQPAIAYTVADQSFLRWYDTIAAAFVTSQFPQATNVMVVHDDVRDTSTSTSDVIVTYQRGTGVFWRQQRDRYTIEYTATASTQGKLSAFGMGTQWRMLWQIDLQIRKPLIKRGPIRSMIGVQVDTLDMTLLTNADVIVQNQPLSQFARNGGFDGARLRFDRYFSASWQAEACGSLNLFTGRVSELTVTGAEVKMSVKSDFELLNIPMPRNVYMAQCAHTLFDSGCTLSAAAFTVTGAVTAGSTTAAINCNLAQAAGYFGLGTVQFTSGLNAGITRTVKLHTTGVLVPSFPLPYVPAIGDAFLAKPGCDKLMATCNSTKFNNVANFRGFPFIPTPEATY